MKRFWLPIVLGGIQGLLIALIDHYYPNRFSFGEFVLGCAILGGIIGLVGGLIMRSRNKKKQRSEIG